MPNSKSILKAAVQGVIWKTALLKIFRNRKRFLRLYVNPFSNYIQNKSIFEIAIRTSELATEAVYNFPKKFHHTCLTVSWIRLCMSKISKKRFDFEKMFICRIIQVTFLPFFQVSLKLLNNWNYLMKVLTLFIFRKYSCSSDF